MPEVGKCLVEECRYNKNFECHAEQIEVRSSGDMVVGASEETACETFKNKAEAITKDPASLEPEPPEQTNI